MGYGTLGLGEKSRGTLETLSRNAKRYANQPFTTTNHEAHFAFPSVHNLDGMPRL